MKAFHRVGPEERRPVLVTGGAGFIGTNLAHRLLSGGIGVIILDNLSRPGVERNLQWLRTQHKEHLTVVAADVREEKAVAGAVRQAGYVFHFAAQVAVTTSLADPITDFEVNARGTLNVLEAIRNAGREIPVLFTSTNKVYGDLHDVPTAPTGTRYSVPAYSPVGDGIGEQRSLDFHSPYGCSKGAAEQYVLDYARTYDMASTVFRMSCIYGPHQCGNEDQGWVAHFLLSALRHEPVTIYGDGRQVRDVLFVDDLIDAMIFAQANVQAVRGRAFNIGGGPGNTISLLELVSLIGSVHGEAPEVKYSKWRAADQRFYVSDIRRYVAATGWKPRVGVREGVRRLHRWLLENRMAEAEISPPAVFAAGRDIPLTRTR